MDRYISLLKRIEAVFTEEYRTSFINDQLCFIDHSGTVFYFIILPQLNGLIVEYADDLDIASQDLYDDGDLIDIDQNFPNLIAEIKEELSHELPTGRKAKVKLQKKGKLT